MAIMKHSKTGLEPIDRTTLVNVMVLSLNTDRPLLVLGEPGISKSDSVRQVADREGYTVVDVRVGNIPPEDMAGIAWPDQATKQVERYMPDVVAACYSAKARTGKPVLLFLDEINHAVHAAQGPLYSIVRERQAAGYALPEGTRIMAAGNPEGTGSISEEMSRALLDRFWVVEFAGPTAQEFDAYAASVSMHPVVRAFLHENPNLLLDFDPEAHTSPTPRAWADLSIVMKGTNDLGLMLQAANGHVGVEVGQKFAAFVEQWGELPLFEDVVKDPHGAKMPASFAAKYMMGLTITAKMGEFWTLEKGRYSSAKTDQDKESRRIVHTSAITYLLRLPTEVQATSLASIFRLDLSSLGENVQSAPFMQLMLSDFRQAAPENSERYNELYETFKNVEASLSALKLNK